MASQTQGIQQLLAAEKRAADKVAEARKKKQRRLKQAKEQAQEEIEKYRQDRERQFKEFEAKYMGSKDVVAARIDSDTKTQLEQMERQQRQNRPQVIDELLKYVYDLKPMLHKNYALQLREQKLYGSK